MGGVPVRFTPLYGVHGCQPLCYLLELGDFVILLDCGWDDGFDPALLRPLHDVLDHVDLVLLSHPDLAHLGALPFLVGRLGLAAPIYGTGPVHKMGQMFMYDHFLCRQAVSDFDVYNLDDVDAAFSPQRFTTLRYQQNVQLSGKGKGITITPLAAGHLLGGTLWRVSRDGDDFVYAVDYNHRKERHLNGTVLDSAFCRPSLLVTDAWNAQQMAPERPSKEKELLDAVLSTLRGDGNVLLPVDPAGRVLELILLLEGHWAQHRLTYPLALLSPMAGNMMEFAKSQLEWMNEVLTRSLGHTRDNPFNTRFLKVLSRREELGRLPQGPKVVLATLPTLGAGPSRQLLLEWAGDPRNAVIFTHQPEEGTLAQQVVQLAAQHAQQPQQPPPTLTVTTSRRVALEGNELQEYLAAQQAQQQMQTEYDAVVAADASQPGSPLAGGSPRAATVTRAHSGTIARLRRQPGSVAGELAVPGTATAVGTAAAAAGSTACLIEGFEVPQGAAGPMFPFENQWADLEYDEYGAAVDPAEFDLSVPKTEARVIETELEGEADVPSTAPAPDAPTKVVSEDRVLALAARVLCFAGWEGRSDGRSMRTMLAHVAPRRCILVHGSTQATLALQTSLQHELSGLQGQVFTPPQGESIDIPAEPSYRVGLSDELMSGVRFHAMADYQLAWVDGRVAEAAPAAELLARLDVRVLRTAAAAMLRDQMHMQGGSVGMLCPAKADGAAAEDGSAYGGVFIGDIRLSELKNALAEVGIASEFHGGTLYCMGHVAVRRQGEEGGLLVEGPLSEDYYRIRDVVYGQYHVC
ncbi:hypothetical protein N2152v2_001673 [Parachlorella kessleri]